MHTHHGIRTPTAHIYVPIKHLINQKLVWLEKLTKLATQSARIVCISVLPVAVLANFATSSHVKPGNANQTLAIQNMVKSSV